MCFLLNVFCAQIQPSSVSSISTVLLEKLMCKAVNKLRSAANDSCSFVTKRVNSVLNLPLKTYDGLANCICPSGTTYAGAGFAFVCCVID